MGYVLQEGNTYLLLCLFLVKSGIQNLRKKCINPWSRKNLRYTAPNVMIASEAWY